MSDPPGRSASIDFFISYTQSDRSWAEWIGWQLTGVGYKVFLQEWDIAPGNDWVHVMHRVSQDASQTLAVMSPAYLHQSDFGEAEWRAAFLDDPTGEQRRLIPVRIAECHPRGLLGTRVYIDLVDRNEEEATDTLLRGVLNQGLRPSRPPSFPGDARAAPLREARYPGASSSLIERSQEAWSVSIVGRAKSDGWTALLRLSRQEHIVEFSFGSFDRVLLDGTVIWKRLLPRTVRAECIVSDGATKRTLLVRSNYRRTTWDIYVDEQRVAQFRAK